MKETLSSIAARLGVSCSTVSRVLSGNPAKFRIPKATAERILLEAERCNYSPSQNARMLRTNKSLTIGLILPGISNPFFAEIASIIMSEIYSKGYTTIIIDSMEDESLEKAGLKSMLSRQVEGIIIAPCSDDVCAIEDIDAGGTPVVLVDRYCENTALSYVTTNNYQGGVSATKTLIDYGHKDIVCIQGVESSTPNQMRTKGYLDAMSQAGYGENSEIVGREFSIRNGYIETRLLLDRGERPSALLALSSTILLGVVKAVSEEGLKIPNDISVISYDNNLFLDYMTPPITRISQPTEDMSRLAVKILFDRIEENVEKSSHIMLSPSLVMGASVGRI